MGIKRIILPASWIGVLPYSSFGEIANLYKPTASVGTDGVNINGVSYSFQ